MSQIYFKNIEHASPLMWILLMYAMCVCVRVIVEQRKPFCFTCLTNVLYIRVYSSLVDECRVICLLPNLLIISYYVQQYHDIDNDTYDYVIKVKFILTSGHIQITKEINY